MFGHDALNYGNIGNLVLNVEAAPDYTGEFTSIEPKGSGVAARYPTGGEQWFANVPQAIAFVESGNHGQGEVAKIYRVVGFDEGDSRLTDGTTTTTNSTVGEPIDCASENREDAAGGEEGCGDCLSGFEEDDTGTCVAVVEDEEEESNTIRNLAIGGVVIGGIYAYFTYFRK